MIEHLKTKQHIHSQLMYLVPHLPDTHTRTEFRNNEILSKLFFMQVTGFSFEDFTKAYHDYPNLIAEFQAHHLVEHGMEISVDSPILTSSFLRDADGNISKSWVRFCIPIRVTAPKEIDTALQTTLYAELKLETHEVQFDDPHNHCNHYPSISMKVSADNDYSYVPKSYDTHFFIKRNATYYARAMRCAVLGAVQIYLQSTRPEIPLCDAPLMTK